MADKSPLEGHPDYLMVDVSTAATRRAAIVDSARAYTQAGQSIADALHQVLLDALHAIVAECAAYAFNGPRDQAAILGDALAESVLASAHVNVHMAQMLGNVADMCESVDKHGVLPSELMFLGHEN